MSRRKRQPEKFDVVEFLRESDDDLKSALNSLLRGQVTGDADGADSVEPGLNLSPGLTLMGAVEAHSEVIASDSLVPGPNLAQIAGVGRSEPAIAESPGMLGSAVEPGADISLEGGPNLTAGSPPLLGQLSRTPAPKLGAGLEIVVPSRAPGLKLEPELMTPDVNLRPGPPSKRHFPIREMKLAPEAHTRAEQQVYEYLWQHAEPLDEVSRTITIGFGGMARLVRLSESNARINVRSLIAKLAIVEFSDYNCERSVGRTYRIFNYPEILKRRREAGLLWYMRRTLAVVFVDPNTGQPIDLGIRRPRSPDPKVGAGINLEAALSSRSLLEALSQYGGADANLIERLRTETRRFCPDFTDEELVHFIHLKGQLIGRRGSGIPNPIGFLLSAVPRCFTGEAFEAFRDRRRQEAAERAQQQAELDNWRRENS